jgi:ankyrin repeat protein
MLRLPADNPLAQSLTAWIHEGHTQDLEGCLAENPSLANALIVDAQGNGRSLLHIATDWPGHFPQVSRTIEVLARAGADPSAPFRPAAPAMPHPQHLHQETPLHWAASSNDLAAIEALLAAGADIEAPGAIFTGGSPLSNAVIFAQWDAARLLLARGAKPTYTQAAALGLLELLRQLHANERPDAETITKAFWHACRAGQRHVAEFLAQRGAEIHWVGWDGLTPLDAALRAGHTELAAWLRGLGAKPAGELSA